MDRFSEQALMLGARKTLVGVLTQPAADAVRADAPCVVILNAGIIHRVGPNRMNVTLARALATAGFSVLRFDLSGLGDSEPRADALAPLDAALADIREVLDMLEATRQVRRVVLVGLCSGADHSVVYAGHDARVVGVVLLDPSIPRTVGYYLHHYGSRLLRMQSWLNVALGRHPQWQALKRRLGGLKEGAADARRPTLDDPEVRHFLQQAYARTLANQVQFLAVLTGGAEQRHNHRRQLFDAFPELNFGSQMQLEYFKESDHTFSSEANRSRVIRLIVDWAGQAPFKSTVPGAEPASLAPG